MNNRVRTKLQTVKAAQPMKHEKKEKVEMEANLVMNAAKATKIQQSTRRERKFALQQDVDKLKKKLRHEENVHRALDRAFNRPLGCLPRLPPYLPRSTMELLAEVAVLEEEVVRLEEQVVNFRQELYQKAIYISTSKNNINFGSNSFTKTPIKPAKEKETTSFTQPTTHLRSIPDDEKGKESQSCISPIRNNALSSTPKKQNFQTPRKKLPTQNIDSPRLQLGSIHQETAQINTISQGETSLSQDSPNKISENILKCLSSIFLRMSASKSKISTHILPSSCEDTSLRDPYGICSESEKLDIGPYKDLYQILATSFNPNRISSSLFLLHRLKLLFGKLALVDLEGLNHQEKLAFWINVYNSCMMNAFLEHGIPESPEMVVALMQKAKVNVGGHALNAITIEHFILRLPYHSKYIFSKGAKNDEMTMRSKFGLELSEPLVTFALSCGSWSSPSVRVYTASEVENELETAKREYLHASIGISTSNKKLTIPKLLDWYLLDFAKDFESLLDWICLQLPTEHGKDAIKCLEREKSDPILGFVQIMPYEFTFRYLLHI